jgi:hypothetical protein
MGLGKQAQRGTSRQRSPTDGKSKFELSMLVGTVDKKYLVILGHAKNLQMAFQSTDYQSLLDPSSS